MMWGSWKCCRRSSISMKTNIYVKVSNADQVIFLKINVMLHKSDVKRSKYKLRVCLWKDTVIVVFDFAEEARRETAQSFLPQLPVRNRLRVLLHQALLPDRVRACWSERTCNTKATTINIHVNISQLHSTFSYSAHFVKDLSCSPRQHNSTARFYWTLFNYFITEVFITIWRRRSWLASLDILSFTKVIRMFFIYFAAI